VHFCTLTSSPSLSELQPSIVFMEDKISLIMEKREYVFLTLEKRASVRDDQVVGFFKGIIILSNASQEEWTIFNIFKFK